MPLARESGLTFTITYVDQCPGAQDVKTTVTTDAAAASLVNYLGLFTGTTLKAEVTMRKENTCTGAGSTNSFTCP